MGRFSPEKEDEIFELFQEHKTYRQAARKAEVDERTVKRIVGHRRSGQSNPSAFRVTTERGHPTNRKRTDIFDFCSMLLDETAAYACLETSGYREILESQGKLTIEQLRDVIRLTQDNMVKTLSRWDHSLNPVRFPKDWISIPCYVCRQPVISCDPSVANSIQLNNVMHPKCKPFARLRNI